MRAVGDQAKTACGNLQLGAGLEASMEGATHAVGKRRLARVRGRREETGEEEASEAKDEEEGGGIASGLNNLTIKTVGTEEEVAGGLSEALRMEVEGSEGEEDGGGTLRALGALELLTQEAEPSGTTLVDARNEFNKLNRLAMLWTVHHRWATGVRFTFNCYKHWAQLLLRQPGELTVTIMRREGVTQGDPLFMVVYRITPAPLKEEL